MPGSCPLPSFWPRGLPVRRIKPASRPDKNSEAALEVYRRGVEASPKSASANKEVGFVLDLLGRYTEARKFFSQAIKTARTPLEKAETRRALAISFGFEHDCKGAEKADRGAYDFFLESQDFYNAGEVADEVGRLCLDAGDLDIAYEWYGRGHEAGMKEPNISRAHQDVWDFRWAHARARIAARRGKLDEAHKFVSTARAILDKGTNPAQQVYFPYLTGTSHFIPATIRPRSRTCRMPHPTIRLSSA